MRVSKDGRVKGNKRNTYEFDEDREFNPYLNSESDDEEDEDWVNDDYLTKYDLEYREGESESQRRKRLKLAREANKRRTYQKEVKKSSSILGLTVFNVLRILLTACAGSFFFFMVILQIYTREIRFPSQEVIIEEQTGMYCLNNWMAALKNMDGGISEFLRLNDGEKSYLENEINYANGNNVKKAFFEKMLSSVVYEPYEVVAKNKYGNDMIDSETGEKVHILSSVSEGESVKLSYVDYNAVEVDSNLVKSMLAEEGLKLGDAGYSGKLATIFCQYMLDLKDLPIKTIDYTPNIYLDGDAYRVSPEEDIFLDKLLFSSDEFHNLLTRFSEVAGANSENPNWEVWNLSANKANTEEPTKVWKSLPVTSEWYNWYYSEDKDTTPEPKKYKDEYVIGDTWCGAYYLQHEYVEVDAEGNEVYRVVEPALGDGTFENPASLNTGVVTSTKYTYRDANNKVVTEDCPIEVTMIEYGVSQDALDWFDSKDERNRGHDIKSEVQYVYYVFRIKNLSSRTLTIKDDSSLCDANVNFSERTGIIYGLQDTVTLAPGQEGIIESWSASTELNRKYIVWGKSLSRETDVVWFRKLAGDLEDTSENKGVTLNTTRFGESE